MVHEENERQRCYRMCADVKKLIADLKTKKMPYSPVEMKKPGVCSLR